MHGRDDNKLELSGTPLERVSFDSGQHKGISGFDAWRELTQPVLNVTRLDTDTDFHSNFEFCDINGLVFNRTAYSATRFERTARHIQGGEFDIIAIQMLLKGREFVDIDGSCFEMNPGNIVVRDWAQSYVSETTESEQICMIVPRHFISRSDDLYTKRPILSWDRSTPVGRIFAEALKEIASSVPNIGPSQAPHLSSGFLGLLNGLIQSKLDSEPIRMERNGVSLPAMRSYLLRHLGSPSLGVDDLVKTFHASRATVYRLFKPFGGVSAFIRDRRLEACMRDLTRSNTQKASLSQISSRWSFHDHGHFCRLFKNRYKITPGEAAHEGHQLSSSAVANGTMTNIDTDLAKIHHWMSGVE